MDVSTLCVNLLNQLNIRDSTANSKITGLGETVYMFNKYELKEYTSNVITTIVPELLDAMQSLKHD
jgi:hypothetical protein